MEAGTSNSTNDGSKDVSNGIYEKITTELKNEAIKETLKIQYTDAKNKITEEAVDLIKEVTRAMIVEASVRAAKQASAENKSTVSVSHVEVILPQLMLDFP